MATGSRGVWDQIREGADPTPGAVAEVAQGWRAHLGLQGAQVAREELHEAVLGHGPLAPLTADPEVSDVVVNGASGVWVDRGAGMERAGVQVGDAEAVRRLAVRLAALAGQRLDDANPWVDGLLPDGVRLHAVLPPLAEGGAHLSLRVPHRRALDLAELRMWGAFDERGEALLRALVAARCAFLVTGGTGTGKTTVLGALLSLVPPSERLVLVEDVRELRVEHPHVVRLQGRIANVEGRGEVGLTHLVRQSLRMRPDRLVVGEVRGAEIRELLAALNTGHEGGCGTMHANAAGDVVARIEALGALAQMSPAAVHAQLASAVQVIVHVHRRGGHRSLAGMGVIQRVDDRVRVVDALSTQPEGWRHGPGWPALQALLKLPRTDAKEQGR